MNIYLEHPKWFATYLKNPSRYFHVNTWKPKTSRFIKTLETPDGLIAWNWMRYSYKANMEENKKRVEKTFRLVYGKPVSFKEKDTGTIICRFKELQKKTGMQVTELAKAIRDYLGYDAKFETKDGKLIKSDKLEKAWDAMQAKQSPFNVEQILYGNVTND